MKVLITTGRRRPDPRPGIRDRRQVGACRDVHFSVCEQPGELKFDAVSRRVAAVRGAAIELSRVFDASDANQ